MAHDDSLSANNVPAKHVLENHVLGEHAMQPPAVFVQTAKQPEAAAFHGFHPVVIAADAPLPPPAGFNPFRPPMPRDLMLLAEITKTDRWAVGRDGQNCQYLRRIREQVSEGFYSRTDVLKDVADALIMNPEPFENLNEKES